MVYAVIDTNVLLPALLTKNKDVATIKVYDAIADGLITPLYHKEILREYDEVLHRSKFGFTEDRIRLLLDMILKYGIEAFPRPTGEKLIDMDDLIFYEVAMDNQERKAYLVTGNLKHYPQKDFIVTPSEMVTIIHSIS